ncbi:MAG: glycosyltransferase family 1 protein [Candidatus Cloacimonetes bacterium]|nr:glycosyltransferase family 1 protein [Candidatus Cloacimonadota bacterium]
MKIILTAIGTRGDIEPFLATGKILKENGHQVICAFSEQFRELTDSSELEFASLGKKYFDLFDSDAGRIAMGGGKGIKKFFAYIKLSINQTAPNKEKEFKLYELIKQERPDRVVYNSKTIYPIIWEYKNSGKTTFLSPFPYLHYVKGHSLLVFGKDYGDFLNKLTFKLYDFGVVTTTMTAKKWLHINDKIMRKEIKKIIRSRNFIYTISPRLFPRPRHWESNIKILGHQALKRKIDWKPEKELTEFIEKHEKILFITFGSMINPEPKRKTKIILKILEQNKIPAIINTASGGLIKPDNFNSELIYFVSQVPYDWIFPKMYAVMHHGGAGTTHLALTFGCATLIIPHFIDQFIWDKTISELGVGPRGIKISRITNKNLEPKVLELLSNKSFKERSERIGNQMGKEDFKEELCRTIIE